MTIRPGPRNLITDVDGIAVGNAHCASVRSGVTVVLPERRAVAACDVRGGAPGTRETDALDPTCLVEAVDGIVLSGGSVYGLEAVSGAVAWLGARKRGFALGETPHVSPVVPGAVLFDLPNGGDKAWGEMPPYRAWGIEACERADSHFELGNVGAGMGAMAGNMKGGLGSASAYDGEIQIGALIAVNPFGSPVIPGTGHFWAAPYELENEFGGRGWPSPIPAVSAEDPVRGSRFDIAPAAPGTNTTIGLVATNAILTKSEARRIAIMAQDGLARAVRPIHSHVDGDTLFVLASGHVALAEDASARLMQLLRLGAVAADCVARAVARGVYAAADLGEAACYRSRYPARD
ncbi:P1 family peptidase [Hyphomicrobium zavarzinii]|jgi:L-aminopeptidase/D-esterase-like protein|uniref:P1 family peptidase n=1 Tax=Hyphomicrobium zavarzinii TaxID=48292 RepID=UPI00036F9AC0|nr:P1 family peptidase [Hyphomicrobium zavarzinii]HML43148.1 P1 family peptidase [Hyphomicrobium zavarzinii]